ncbi:MAG: hypothetical protein HQL56_04430 [Magnetococcales bacterium]|nr:hypothetical protein [Magnetococcales bacterium]
MKIRMMAAFSYLGVLCLVPLLLNRDDAYVAFHARQGLVLWIWAVISFFVMHLPGLGPYLFSTSTVLITFASLAGLVSVLLNRSWKLPFIGDMAARFFAAPEVESRRG